MRIKTGYPQTAGIYKLTCNSNGKVYIGKAVNISKRLAVHKYYSNTTKKDSYLKRAVIKHGWDDFAVDILELVENFDKLKDNDSLLCREAYYIELYNSTNKDKGYNICKVGSDRTGLFHTEETKEKIRVSNLGKIVSEETKEKNRISNLGKTLSKETRERMSISRLGNSNRLGKPTSIETKEKISAANSGRIVSLETREKLRQAGLGKKKSEATKAKLREARLRNMSRCS